MKIAQIAPLYESVPPKMYGGTERVVYNLTEALVALGHDVTLFASGDSKSSAKLVPFCEKALRLDPSCLDPMALHLAMAEMVERSSNCFDIIHSHVDYLNYPIIERSKSIYITTLHGRLDLPELQSIYKLYNKIPVISISDYQRRPIPLANWKGTVYHGLSLKLFSCNSEKGTYLSYVGRISPEKRVDRAIEIAIRAGVPLKIAAKVDKADKEYHHDVIRPLLSHPLIEFLGEVNDREKEILLKNSMAMLYPIDWPEPFGLAMIESMACGTPVVAFRNGSVPEVIDEGITGFIVNSIEEAVKAVQKINKIDRTQCRKKFEERFSSERMARDYLKIYSSMIMQSEYESLLEEDLLNAEG